MNQVKILGIKIDNFSLQEVLEKINSFLQSKDKHYIVTPNPEFLVAAKKDKAFAQILNYADISIADGIGLIYAAKFLGQRLQRITGADLVGFLSELAEQKNYPIFLLGGRADTAEKTAKVLRDTFESIQIVGTDNGGEISPDGKISSNPTLVEKINNAKPKILLVALGQAKQEKWIFHHLDQLKTVKVAIGVGGAFDYIAGNIKRAPELIRNLGLEWLYRLTQEPWRWQRIFNAVIIFPLLVLWQKIKPAKNNEE